MSLPYLTATLPGIGGSIKNRPEDFFVQELPLYQPTGDGEHIYCEIQKIGLTTFDTIDRLARALHVHPKDIGYAGLKDARAITRQLFSILGSSEQAVASLQLPNLSVLWTARHGNKLRQGHLAANRFAIKIRDVNPTDVVKLQPYIDILKTTGLPNYFGEQRFGRRGDNHLLGAALIRGDDPAVLSLLLGSPNSSLDDAQTQGARKAFDRNDLEHAMRLFPRRSGMERRVLARLIKTGNPSIAVRTVDENLRRLWVSALQSDLFNEIVAHRINSLNRLSDGDLAMKHENGACFLVESAATEQPRCDSFEISPTGPLVGYRMTLPQGEALGIEQEVMAAHNLKPEDFRVEGRHKVKGARRPLRIQPKDIELSGGVDEFGQHITVAFTLPPGSFATVLLRELMKSPAGE
ncbi:MAG: tRNA pseudouridine(13) synthase TruD [Planctomycetota bacterium]|nr:tRNA pseudouridine(13) synthase TruD [Planctomycetota bacterium]